MRSFLTSLVLTAKLTLTIVIAEDKGNGDFSVGSYYTQRLTKTGKSPEIKEIIEQIDAEMNPSPPIINYDPFIEAVKNKTKKQDVRKILAQIIFDSPDKIYTNVTTTELTHVIQDCIKEKTLTEADTHYLKLKKESTFWDTSIFNFCASRNFKSLESLHIYEEFCASQECITEISKKLDREPLSRKQFLNIIKRISNNKRYTPYVRHFPKTSSPTIMTDQKDPILLKNLSPTLQLTAEEIASQISKNWRLQFSNESL